MRQINKPRTKLLTSCSKTKARAAGLPSLGSTPRGTGEHPAPSSKRTSYNRRQIIKDFGTNVQPADSCNYSAKRSGCFSSALTNQMKSRRQIKLNRRIMALENMRARLPALKNNTIVSRTSKRRAASSFLRSNAHERDQHNRFTNKKTKRRFNVPTFICCSLYFDLFHFNRSLISDFL